MHPMRKYLKMLEIARPPRPDDPPEVSLTDEQLMDRFVNAATYGWSKPQMGTPSRDKLDRYMADAAFRDRISTVRPDWLTGEGDAHVGAMYHGRWD